MRGNIAMSSTEVPMGDESDYRKALSCFVTGVTVVTANWKDKDWGMTCNSFCSVSLTPRLVLWSIRKTSSSFEAFSQSGGFTVNVLSHDQLDLARQFATGDMESRFLGISGRRLQSDRLKLNACVAWFDCTLYKLVEAGDHFILIGQVERFGWQNNDALTYWHSQFSLIEDAKTPC